MLISNLHHRNMNCNVFESSSENNPFTFFTWKVSVVLIYMFFFFWLHSVSLPLLTSLYVFCWRKLWRFTAVLSESSWHSCSYKLKIISKLLNKFKLYFFFEGCVKKAPYITFIIICNIRSSVFRSFEHNSWYVSFAFWVCVCWELLSDIRMLLCSMFFVYVE